MSGSDSKGINSGNDTESKDKDDSTLQEDDAFETINNSDTESDDIGCNNDDNDSTVTDITEYEVSTNLDDNKRNDKEARKISLFDGPPLFSQVRLGDKCGAVNGTATVTREGKSEDSAEQEAGDGVLERIEMATIFDNEESGKSLFNKVVLGERDETINDTSNIAEDSTRQRNDTG